jgi:hypothetical protein
VRLIIQTCEHLTGGELIPDLNQERVDPPADLEPE